MIYDTGVTDDVVGRLSEHDVDRYLSMIEELPAVEKLSRSPLDLNETTDVNSHVLSVKLCMKHKLKILPEHFEKIINAKKTFIICINDRAYQAGDIVELEEYYDPSMFIHKSITDLYSEELIEYYDENKLTGRVFKAKIGYATSYQQKENWVVMSFLPFNIFSED